MNKQILEYLIVATVIVLLVYGCYSMVEYQYHDKQANITDSIIMYCPSSSDYTVVGDTVEFRNPYYTFYDMDVSKLSSSDEKVTNLLNHFSNVNQGSISYKNESCYLVDIEFDDQNGFKYHSMIVPLDSFNKDNLSFSKESKVYLFDGHDKNHVIYGALNSQVVL